MTGIYICIWRVQSKTNRNIQRHMRNGCLIVECTDRGQKVTHILIVICKDYFVFITIFFFLFLKHAIHPRMALNRVSPASTIWVKGFGYILSCTHSYLSRCSQTPEGLTRHYEMSWKGDPGRWESADLDEGSKLRSSESTQVLLVLAISSPQTLILIIYLEWKFLWF